jgi:hypothetical protein
LGDVFLLYIRLMGGDFHHYLELGGQILAL